MTSKPPPPPLSEMIFVISFTGIGFGATTLMLYAFDTTQRRFSLNRYAALRTLLHDSLLFILYTIITRRCIIGKLYIGCKCLQFSYDTLSRNMRTVRTPLFVTSFFLFVFLAADSPRWKIALRLLMSAPAIFFTPAISYWTYFASYISSPWKEHENKTVKYCGEKK